MIFHKGLQSRFVFQHLVKWMLQKRFSQGSDRSMNIAKAHGNNEFQSKKVLGPTSTTAMVPAKASETEFPVGQY
jgi:hypothetical protein